MERVPRVLILGAGGFVGGTLAREVRQRLGPLALVACGKADFDVSDPTTWSALREGIDCVIHAAAKQDGTSDEMFAVNARHAGRLAERCNEVRVKTLVYLSSGAVYGPNPEPTSAQTPCRPRSDYAVAKYRAEQEIGSIFGGRLHILRLYFPYGRGQKTPRLIPRIVERIREGQPIVCNADGGPRLNLGHVEDLCRLILDDFILREEGPRVTNLASDRIGSIEGIARVLADALGCPVRFERLGAEPDVLSVPYRPGAWRDFRAEDVLDLRAGRAAGGG